ncbi:MAG: endonuclease/exonuclease/phosphatase family protein [Gammaproteobacteria bacterium]|nr:endonuclease/exonuclease/phosphatase family protein [Gammaproteobacteria bacterium]
MTHHVERRFFSRLIRLVFLTVSLATVIALFSRAHWFAELFSHFRFYFLLAQALLVLIFLHSGRWVLMAVTLMLAVPNAWYVVPYLTPLVMNQSVAAEQGKGIDIVAFNLNYRNEDHRAVREYLAAESPDVIVVAEVTEAWSDALSYLLDEYPYATGEWRSEPWGLMVYSRLPFVEAELLDLGVSGTVHARVVLDVDDKLLQVFAVHLYSPTNPQRAARRNRQLDDLARQVNASAVPTIVVGDLNVTPFSPYFANLLNGAGVVDARRPSGFHFTWPTSAAPLWIPIDHVLSDPSVIVTRVSRGPDTGSDHYPLEVSVVCCEAEPG